MTLRAASINNEMISSSQQSASSAKNHVANFWEVLNINTRSIKNHHDEIEALIGSLESSPNILAITETWLNETDEINCYKIKGFEPLISKSRISTKGESVMIQGDKLLK